MPNTRRNARVLKLRRRCTFMHLPCFVICRALIYPSIFPGIPITCSAQSTIINKSRLRLLHKREEVLQQIFSAVREPSTPLCETAGRYEQFLEGTLAESFLYILEPTLIIHSRKSDVDIVNQAATTASRTYKEISGRVISFEVQGTISDEAYVSIQRSAWGFQS